jgi:hypothetical protein
MRRATITIPDELEKVLDAYRGDLEFPPSLAAVMQIALKEDLSQRGDSTLDERPGTRAGTSGQRPAMYEDAPTVRGEKTAAEMVIEDRR